MKITITSGASRVEVDKSYLDKSREIINYLADQGCELNWGSGKFCIMGICYEEFNKRGNKINGYTTKKYLFELDDLPNAEHYVFDDTFDLKKHLFNDSDIIICLPGGIGSISEPLSYIEEIRSNDRSQKLLICNINGWFNKIEECLRHLAKENFISDDVFSCYKLVNTFDEFVEAFENLKKQLN